jgi:hypothetical protein
MLVTLCVAALAAVAPQRPPDIQVTPEIRREVVSNVGRALRKYYLSAEIAERVAADLAQRLARGEYDRISSAFDLVDALDLHMQAVSKDAHLALAYSHRAQPMPAEIGGEIVPETREQRAEALEEARRSHFGFEKIARLPGNVALIELNSFVRPELAGEAAGNAFSLVAGADALILDLRARSLSRRALRRAPATHAAAHVEPAGHCASLG